MYQVIFSWSKLATSNIKSQSEDELLGNVFDLFQKDAENKGLKLQFVTDDNVPNALIGDPLRIRQVLIKFSYFIPHGNRAVKEIMINRLPLHKTIACRCNPLEFFIQRP